MHTKTNIVAFKLNNVVLVCTRQKCIYIHFIQTVVFKFFFAFKLNNVVLVCTRQNAKISILSKLLCLNAFLHLNSNEYCDQTQSFAFKILNATNIVINRKLVIIFFKLDSLKKFS